MGGSIADIQKVSNPDGTPIGGGGSAVAPVVQGASTDKSGTITTGGVSQTICAANPNRRSFTFQNNSLGDLWLRFSASAAAASQPSWRIVPGDGWVEEGSYVDTNAIQVFGATTGQTFSAKEA